MPSNRQSHAELQQAKRELRAQSARLRRGVNSHVHGLIREQARLRSWRTWVRRFPLPAVGIAFGIGLAAAVGLRRTKADKQNVFESFISSWAVPRLMRWATSAITSGLLTELLKTWSTSKPAEAPVSGEQA